MEEDTPKIRDTTGTIFIQGPSIVLPVWRCIMINNSYFRACMKLWIVQKIRFSLLESGEPRHGARVWCLSRVPKHRNQWQEVGACYLAPKIFKYPTGPIALDSEPRGRRYVKNMGDNRNRLYSRAIHCPASMEKYYVQWFILKSL